MVTSVDDLGDTAPTAGNIGEPQVSNGMGGFVPTGNAFTVAARSRTNLNQNNRQIVTVVDFNVSSLTIAEVSDPAFVATLALDYVGQLNDLNGPIGVSVGQVASNAALNFDLGYDDGDGGSTAGTIALNTTTILDVGAGATPSGAVATGDSVPYTVDVTPIIVDWFNNPTNNNGLIFFMDDAGAAQGAYFNNLQITTAVPEPSTALLGCLALAGLIGARKRG
ncbi:MAG: PEP-CTERM sorting domain-containing protein [Roseibacillus sp.]